MTRTALVALALLACAAAPAAAADDSHYLNGCYVDAVAVPTGQVGEPETYTARIGAEIPVYSTSGEPVSATVTCALRVRRVVVHEVSFSGTTVVVGSEWAEFSADLPLEVSTCTTVDFTSDDTPTRTVCPESQTYEFPPPVVWDVADVVVGSVPGDPEALCTAVTLADAGVPDVWGVFMITDDGRIAPGSNSNGWRACPA